MPCESADKRMPIKVLFSILVVAECNLYYTEHSPILCRENICIQVAIFVDIAFHEEDPNEVDLECLYWVGEHEDKDPIRVPGKAVRIFDDKNRYAP